MSSPALTIAISLLLGVGVPYLGMRMLVPSLAQGPTVENFRGRRVFPGLGIAWLLWAAAAIVGGVLGQALAGETSVLPVLTLAGPLALVAFSVGLVDDAYGTGADKGFRGHLKAAARGRLTTGGMKLLGVSVASYVVALVLAMASEPTAGTAAHALMAVPMGAAIALTANFVNLTDLRPGRALKVYAVLAVFGVISVVMGLGALVSANATTLFTDLLSIALFAFGPLLATWRYDLGEQGMMGDAGANAAGAVGGLFIVSGLPLWATGVYVAVMLGLNLASERYSFSKIIEGSRILTRLDALGRLPRDSGL